MAATSQVPSPSIGAQRVRARRISWQRIGVRSLLYIVLIAGAVLFIVPLLWLISTSLKPETDIFLFPPRLFPSRFDWLTYPGALEPYPFLQ